jgi:hypothetical protein
VSLPVVERVVYYRERTELLGRTLLGLGAHGLSSAPLGHEPGSANPEHAKTGPDSTRETVNALSGVAIERTGKSTPYGLRGSGAIRPSKFHEAFQFLRHSSERLSSIK